MSRRFALVVDDDPVSRAVLAHVLTKRGLTVDEAEDTSEARSMMTLETYDVVFSDYHMPREDGISFIASLTSSTSRPRCVLVSGVLDVPRPDPANDGIDAVLAKPVTTAGVAACLRALGMSREPI